VLGFSAAVGLMAVFQFRDSPFFNLPIIDEESYVTWARQIVSGDVMGRQVFYQDPLYPYFLAGIFEVFGENFLLVRLLQVLMGTMSVAVVYWTGRKLLGHWPGLAAAAVIACYRGLYFFELQILKSTMVVLLSAVACALGVAAVDRPRSWWRWAALGFNLGLLTLLRGNFQPILPLMLLWAFLIWREDGFRARVLRVGLVAVGIGLAIAPVTVRNYLLSGEVILTTSQGGANFFIGNSERATGRYVTLPFVRANPMWEAKDFQAEAEKRAGRKLDPMQVSSFWFGESFKWIQAHPQKAAALTLHKARLLIHQYEIPDNHSLYLTRQTFVPVLYLPFLGFGLLWGIAIVGMAWLVRRDRRALFPALFALLYGLSIVPFFIVDRYRLALVPALALFAGLAGFLALEKYRAQETRSLVLAAGFLALALALGFLPTTESKSPMGMEYYLLGNAYLKTGNPAAAIPYYDLALRVLPDNQDIVNNRVAAIRQVKGPEISTLLAEIKQGDQTAERLVAIGRELETAGDFAAAVQAYEAAALKDPSFFPARARLGFLYAVSPQVKNPLKAIANLTVALELKPGDLDTLNALANTHFLAGNTTEARKLWEQILVKNPNHSAALKNLQILRDLPPGK
jgi:4-amino-4-deoxy-L-arabinose transferase-like glycosyltransferase